MSETQTSIKLSGNGYHFWFILATSLFLIVTFVFYLPLRFRSSLIDDHRDGEMMDGEMMANEHGMGEPVDHAVAHYEENEITEGLVVNLNILDVPYRTDRPLFFNFWVNEMPDRQPVSLDQLEIEHEKLMHVVGVRSDMNGFFHLHPQADVSSTQNNHLLITHQLNLPGRYKIWSEIKKDGINHTFGHSEINVIGEGATENKKVSLARQVTVGPYQLSLFTKEPVSKGRVQRLSLDLHTLTGRELETENYLGAKMHLAIIKDDWSQFRHIHPNARDNHPHAFWPIKAAGAHGGVEDGSPIGDEIDETIDFEVVFPEAGLYKAFAQFRPEGSNLPEGEVLLADFWIQVQEKAPPVVSSQIWLVAISAILIVVLSLAVRNYLKVKPAKRE